MKTKTYTIEEQNNIGRTIATILCLRQDRDHQTRYQTCWGSKTNLGIFNTIQRLANDIKQGNEIAV